MTTPLYPTFEKRVEDAIEQLIKQQVTPWSFLKVSHPFRIKMFDGREIAYEGVGFFDGSPRLVFWSPQYIKPFLEHLCISEIDAAVSLAREKRVDAKLLLPELQNLLSSGCGRVYREMADVDRRLRGRGYPQSVKLRPVDEECQAMDRFITERVRAEIKMWTSFPRRLERCYEQNKPWFWAIGILAASGLLAPIIRSCTVFIIRLCDQFIRLFSSAP
jgi:hypothetical protein